MGNGIVFTLLAVLFLGCVANISAQTTLNKNFKMPKNIKSYTQYLKYAGMATGALPIEPLAEDVLAPAQGPSSGAAAPFGAPAGEGQPSYLANHVPNPNPTIDDFVEAYKPVGAALDKAFEQRITGDNAKTVQWELAVAAAPLQMLINDANQAQIKNFQQIASSVIGTNALTGTTATAPSPAAQAPTASDGTTVTSTAGTAATADTTTATPTTSSDPLGWLRIPFLGKK